MIAQFKDIHAAADYIGPGAIEVPQYNSEITDIVRRRGVFGLAHQAGSRDWSPVAVF